MRFEFRRGDNQRNDAWSCALPEDFPLGRVQGREKVRRAFLLYAETGRAAYTTLVSATPGVRERSFDHSPMWRRQNAVKIEPSALDLKRAAIRELLSAAAAMC